MIPPASQAAQPPPLQVAGPVVSRPCGSSISCTLGRARVIGCWQVGDVLIDPVPSSCLPVLLDALGEERPSALLLTHIHFDHAGAAGTLVERWPDLPVYVHERGARHMVDPERLYESAQRLYGDEMERRWGEMLPVPQENLQC